METPNLKREDTLECAICLQSCMQPVQLPCSHVFCFLCAKGIAMQSRKCALCRSDIPPDFITKPSQFTKSGNINETSSSAARYVWYYQGYNGWWQYDDRTCLEIEAAYTNKSKSIDVLVAGSVYVIDFENEIQYQRHRNSRKRKIKRDLETANKKGVAGLESNKKEMAAVPQPSCSSNATASSSSDQSNNASNSDLPVQIEESDCQNSLRQIPVGSDNELQENSTDANNLSNAVQTPDMVRTASDTTNMSSQTSVTPLFRHNTYSHADHTGDAPME